MSDAVLVTNHALVRYMRRKKQADLLDLCRGAGSDSERLARLSMCHGVDVEAVRDEVAGLCRRGVDVGANAVKVDGLKFVLKGSSVVTCY
jgi:hypothetical protein